MVQEQWCPQVVIGILRVMVKNPIKFIKGALLLTWPKEK